ncbi:MAG: hypothetical protein ABIP03_07730 [Aquihabitans sp.]
MVVVVDVTGTAPLSANLRFAEGGAPTPLQPDPTRPGRFSITVKLRKASVTPQVIASSGAALSRADSTTTQLERCVVID